MTTATDVATTRITAVGRSDIGPSGSTSIGLLGGSTSSPGWASGTGADAEAVPDDLSADPSGVVGFPATKSDFLGDLVMAAPRARKAIGVVPT